MISELLPQICPSEDECRIVIVSSHNHMKAHFDADYAATSKMKKYNAFQTYANCKLFQVLARQGKKNFLLHLLLYWKKLINVEIKNNVVWHIFWSRILPLS